jgi:hypothetical protein
MRKVICVGNLIIVALATCISILATRDWILSPKGRFDWVSVIPVVWAVCALFLLKSQRLWPWIGSLLAVSAMALSFGAETLKFIELSWRASYGDTTVEVDPTTIGIPLVCLGIFTIGFLFVLIVLFSLPAWSAPKKQMPDTTPDSRL